SVTVQSSSPPPSPITSQTAQPSAPPPLRLDPTRLMEDNAPVMGWLAVKKGAQPGRQFKLGTGRNGIGRDGAACKIVLDDTSASKQHAQVNFEGGQFFAYDMASTNGTFVNGQRLQKRQMLYDNDEIRIGDTVLTFKKV
ncbi:MAG: FHA domain-containing protein, partial [Chloroflexota bacterium]